MWNFGLLLMIWLVVCGVSYVLLLLLFGVVVVGEGVDIMYVGSGVDHKSLLLLMILVVCMGGEGVGVGIVFGGNGSAHWSPVVLW